LITRDGSIFLSSFHWFSIAERHRLRRDVQPLGHLFFVAADEHPQHVLLEAVPVTAPLAAQQFHAGRQVQFHLDFDLRHPWPP
jgi:hypothetical protein